MFRIFSPDNTSENAIDTFPIRAECILRTFDELMLKKHDSFPTDATIPFTGDTPTILVQHGIVGSIKI